MAKPLLIIKRRLRHIPLSSSVTRLPTYTIVWKCHDCFWQDADSPAMSDIVPPMSGDFVFFAFADVGRLPKCR